MYLIYIFTISIFVGLASVFIPVFISCGLIYSAISDNCFMGMMLMKLPYNKKLYKTKPASCKI